MASGWVPAASGERPYTSSPRISTSETWFFSTRSRKSENAISLVPARVVVMKFHNSTTDTMMTTNNSAFLTFWFTCSPNSSGGVP